MRISSGTTDQYIYFVGVDETDVWIDGNDFKGQSDLKLFKTPEHLVTTNNRGI